MGALEDFLQARFQRLLDIEPADVSARGHQRLDGAITKAQNALNHVVLDLFEHARISALTNYRLDLVLGDIRFAGGRNPQQLHQGFGRIAEQMNNRTAGPRQPAHAGCHGASQTLGTGQGQALGHQLADYHR